MMKFLRKHMKQMLAVFTALLLISWLGGSALQQYLAPKPQKNVIGYAFDEKIQRYRLTVATRETGALQMLRLPWDRPWVLTSTGRAVMLRGLEPIDWILLREEADRQGITVKLSEVEQLLKAVDPQGIGRQQLQQRMSMSREGIRLAVANYLKIVELGEIVGSSAKISDAEVKHAIADRQERLAIRMVLLDSERFGTSETEVSNDELEKQFQAYRDKPEGSGEYGFGYLFPERVRIQYMGVDTQALAKLVRVTVSQAREYWKANKESPIFERPKPSTQPTTASAPATKPATKPADKEKEKPEYFATFTQAKEAALEHLRKEKAQTEAARLLNDVIGQLSVDFSTAEVRKDGYGVAPEAVKAPDYYASIHQRFAKMRHGEALRLYKSDKWLTQEDLAKLEEIGDAVMGGGGACAPMPFTQLAIQVQGLRTIPKGEGVDRSHYVALYQTCVAPLRGEDGNYYIFRVVGARKPQAPDKLDQVVDAVKADVLSLRRQKATRQIAERLAKQAKASNLEKTWSDEKELKERVGPNEGFQRPSPFCRVGPGSAVPGIGINETFIDACFSLAQSNPSSQADKIRVVELPKERKWVVVEYVKTDHTTRDHYVMLKPFMQQRLMMEKGRDILTDWYSSENIRKRTGFRFASDDDEKEAGAEG